MSSEGVNSLAQRVLSLEDIIRQQEQTISAVLQRLRDVEQYAAAESRSREQAQQQLQAAFGNHNGSTAETLNRMQALLQSHNDRLSTLQAEVQGQGAALRGTNDKHDVAFREMEKRLQAELSGAHQRAQTGETASAEAMRALQAQLQSMANVTQAVETRNHDDLVGLQQQISAELAMQRQRCDNLESAIRDALRDVHGSLSGDVRSAGAQQRSDLEAAVQRINQELEALSQRTRIDMNQLHSTEQTDVSDLRCRIGELEYGVREAVQAATNGLAHEVAQVAQHSQMQDKRQETAHQAILQELAKHDTQLETVDLNWRASVTDLGAKMREDVAAAQQRSVAGDQALQSQVGALQDRLVEMANKLRGDLTALATSMQENCVRPLQEAHHTLSVQGQRMSRIADDYASMQDYLTTFAAHVDEDVGQSKQIMEAAVRAAHSDLLERINLISMPNTLHQDSDMRAEVNRSLAKLWEDAKGVFLTQRSLDDIQTQLMTLESAVRVELCALAERLNEVWRTVDKHHIGELRAAQQPITPAAVTGMAPEQSSSHHFAAASAAISTVTTPVASSFTRTHRNQVSAVLTKASKSTAELPTTGATATTAAPWSSKAAKTSRASSVTAKVEEIYKDSDEQNERLRQHEEDIKALWASLQRLHTAQTPELSKPASSTQWNNVSTIHPATAAGAEVDRASIEAQSAAREAAESAKAAESAQDECVRAANELRLAVQRVSVLEESLQMQLTEAKVMLSAATPKQQAQPPQPLPRKTDKPLAASFAAKTTPPYSSPPKKLVAKGEAETAKGEAAKDAKGEAAKDAKTGVSGAAASITPRSANRPTAHTSLSAEALATPADDLVEVPGMLTGEVFIVRKDKIDATSSASVRRRPATAGTATFLPRPVDSSGALVRSTLGDSVVPEPSSHRGSSSEVLLPTHQFVRKREYSNFKDFTKREIDTIWVELLSMRRTHGLSKEEVLLYISQSKEQILGTVLNIVQQQEKEVLGILGNIKTQLTELDRNPDAVREIRVFPVDSGQNLENFVRSLSGYLKAVPVAAQAEPLSTAATAAGQPQSGVRKGVSRPATDRPVARRTGASTTATTTPPGQSLRPTERGNESGACTSRSSACSSLPVQPQLISPMVKRRASQPTLRPELQEAVCVSLEVSSPKSDSSSQRKPSHCPAPKHNSSASQQHARQYATDAVVHPQSARPARRLSEPECIGAQHQLASISSTTVQVSQAKSSPLSSGHASVGRQLLLGGRLAAASAGPGPSGGSDPCCYASPQSDHTAPPPDQPSSPSGSAVRGCTGGDLKCFLKESKSPRNSTGSSFHLNPLQGIVGSRFQSPTEPGVRRAATATAVLATATPSRSIDSESQLLEADQRQPYTRLPRCPLRGHSLSLLTTSQAEAPDAPRPKDTSFEKYESVTICQESETSYQSVGSMRPLRSGVQHRSVDSMDGTSARGGISAACVREPRHLYERQTPMPGQYRSLSAQFPTPMAQPQPRGYSPARDGSSTSVSIDTNPPRRPAQVHTTAVSGTIRLGPYRKPPGDDTNNLTIASRTSISSCIDHTPHVNVSGGRNDDRSTRSMHSALQSLDCSIPNQPHSSATMPSNVVPVRVLDNPVNRSDDSSSLDRSLVIVHPYNKP
ncbi:hypothetical protein, conserved [Leishmania lindenbergi]|uniref:Actin interacting protein 3-like C-terminal domain-containing protein n=1 Tax=Leishmania lindenbergi TaxID=651832 RepID=A0AAW3ADI9_9TRYP